MRNIAWHKWIGALCIVAAPACSSNNTGEITVPTATATGVAPMATATVVASAKPITPPRADATLIKRQILFGNPDRMGVQLSPNGKQLSFLAPKDGVMNVWVGPA